MGDTLLTELIIEEWDNEIPRIRYFSVPTNWLEEQITGFTGLSEFMNNYTSEESSNIYSKAILENKVIKESVIH